MVETGCQVHQVLDHQQELFVVFGNGGVQTMTALQNAGRDVPVVVKGVLEEGQKVVQCQLHQKGSATLLGLLVSDGEGKEVSLVTCRVVLDGDERRSVAVEEREVVGSQEELVVLHLAPDLTLYSLSKQESALQKWAGGNWQKIIEVTTLLIHSNCKWFVGTWLGSCSSY